LLRGHLDKVSLVNGPPYMSWSAASVAVFFVNVLTKLALDAEPGLEVVGLADVLRAIAAGRSNAEIATELYISEVTVKSHINHLFAKIHARNRAEAVRYAYDHGLVSPQP
jgi:DNA-binding CsgD family transcriptional regulator